MRWMIRSLFLICYFLENMQFQLERKRLRMDKGKGWLWRVLFSFFFSCTMAYGNSPGQGSSWRSVAATKVTAVAIPHCAGPGSEPIPLQRKLHILNLLYHSRNSYESFLKCPSEGVIELPGPVISAVNMTFVIYMYCCPGTGRWRLWLPQFPSNLSFQKYFSMLFLQLCACLRYVAHRFIIRPGLFHSLVFVGLFQRTETSTV